MNLKMFAFVMGAVCSLLAVAHVARLAFQWEVMVQGILVPVWMSLPAAVVLGALAAEGFSLALHGGGKGG